MKEIRLYLMVILFIGLSSTLFAQGNNEYIAVDEYQRTIAKSEKLNTQPQLSDSVIELSPIKFYIEPTYYEVTFETEPIKPARLKIKEPLEKLYRGYVKAGLGMYTMPYLDVYYGSTRSKLESWGINLKHHSSLTNLKGVGYNRFSDNYISGFHKHFLKKATINNKVSYSRNKYHYYGFDSNDTIIPETYRTNSDTTKQVFQQINYEGLLKSMHKDSSKISHTTNLYYYYLNGLTGVEEHDVKIKSNIYKYIDREEVGADVSFVFNNLSQPLFSPIGSNVTLTPDSRFKSNNSIFKLNPFIKTRRGNLLAKVGVGIHTEFTQTARFFFYPDLTVSYSLFNNIFVPYAGITGGMQQNSFDKFRKANPYVLENISTIHLQQTVGYRNTNQRINFYGGFKGSISSTVSFNLKAQFERLDNFAMFVNDTMYSYNNKFRVEYDSIDKTTISAQIGYQLQEKINLSLKGMLFNYSTLEEDYAWNQPNYIIALDGTYDLADKIIARLNITIVGERKTYSLLPVDGVTANSDGKYIYDLKSYVDANLGVEYRYNKRLSAYLDLNNIAGKKYQVWNNYPVYSFNLMGGVTYSF